MKTALICIGLIVASSPSVAGTWNRSDEPSSHRAWVEAGKGNRIELTCDGSAETNKTVAIITIDGLRPMPETNVSFIFDKSPAETFSANGNGIFSSECNSCAGVFGGIVQGLVKSKSVQVKFSNGAEAQFSLAGSANAIGECTPDFYQVPTD